MSEKKFVLITGASGGIGLELAKVFAANGHHLILVARNDNKLKAEALKLQEQYQIKVHTYSMDLCLKESSDTLYKTIKAEDIKVDILINNAGFGYLGFFPDSQWKDLSEMIDLNIKALTHLTYLFSKDMADRGYGKILNIASIASFTPGPFMAVYYATKAYVLSLTYALENELKNKGVQVSALCPGPVNTGFAERASLGSNPAYDYLALDSESVALIGFKKLMKGQTIIIPGFINKISIFFIRLLPQGLNTRLMGMVQRKKQ